MSFFLPVILSMLGCAMTNPASSGSPQNPPIPATPSILPLETGNHWVYTNMVYDSAGNILFNRYPLELNIPRAFGISSTTLTPIDWNNYLNTYTDYCFAYEWDNCGYGYLIQHRGKNVTQRGVYIVGEFTGTSGVLYDSAYLWLAYPSTPGFTYTINTDTTGDTTGQSYMEVVSINAPYYFADSSSGKASPVTFVNCYLYKEQYADTISYYWYNEELGAVAYQQMYHGKKIKTYTLREFNSDAYYYYY
jgi:hypothetical protein